MSSELHDSIKRAAPAPGHPLDEKQLARRARRLSASRGLAVAVVLALLGGGIALATGDGPSQIGPVEHGNEAPDVPDGPRHEVLSGRYGDDWASDPGKRWRLLVWGEGHTECWQVATTDPPPAREGLSCTAPADGQELEEEPFLGNMYFFTQSSDPDEFWFGVGVLSPLVEALEFRPDQGGPVDIEIVDAPPESGSELRYYAATLPTFDRADLVAFDDQGEILGTQEICGPGCEADREAQNEQKVSAWEAEPIAPMSKAAAFANLAVGAAGLGDLSGTFLAYEGIATVGDRFRASFKASGCGPSLTYQCDIRLGSAYIDVAVQGRRLGRLEVTGVDGPFSEQEREKLLSFVRGDEFGPHWEESQTSVSDGPEGERALIYSLVWMGNLPPPVADYGSLCRLAVLDREGALIHEGRTFPLEVRRNEYSRVHSPLSELESDKPVGEVLVDCDEPQANLTEQLRREGS